MRAYNMSSLDKFFSPLEQFEIQAVLPMSIFGFDLSLTNSSLYIISVIFVCLGFFFLSLTPSQMLVPTRWQYVIEQAYTFVLDILKQQAGYRSLSYFPALLSIFLFIAVSNLIGLTPFGFTSTSHIIVTFTFALAFNLGIFILGLYLHSFKFFSLFVPSGVPKALLPLIVVIEVISYLIRTFSLSLRLFANMDGRTHTSTNFIFFCCCFLVVGRYFYSFCCFSSCFGSCRYSFGGWYRFFTSLRVYHPFGYIFE